jgi:hypothetical protein
MSAEGWFDLQSEYFFDYMHTKACNLDGVASWRLAISKLR